ncbi:hypothetical protein SLEP1_g22457 [Rubroshorea leprosula]|uniref:Uncharacterized protein n=1 Tax=Rubroshorea leprosula TaxID=152421 RepID=A0AAV5J985_9ROSI|nr:hypothetical protein SLEP1_g22457 [Rubroshorea leprosula]
MEPMPKPRPGFGGTPSTGFHRTQARVRWNSALGFHPTQALGSMEPALGFPGTPNARVRLGMKQTQKARFTDWKLKTRKKKTEGSIFRRLILRADTESEERREREGE